MTEGQRYKIFGLTVQSDLALPELYPAEETGEADVTVELGTVTDLGPGVHLHNGAVILNVPEVGRYEIARGKAVTIDPRPGVPIRNLRLYLLGSGLGLLLHQRGMLPLHANAIEIEGRAIAFMGESGAGKSTLAAWFHDRGFRILSDDVCVVEIAEDGQPRALPGIARMRLWREVLDATGRDVADYERSFISEDAPDKYDIPPDEPCAGDARLPLAALYLLDRGDAFEIEALTGTAAMEAAFAHTYRGSYVARFGCSDDHWASTVGLVRSTPIFLAKRCWGLDQLDQQSAGLLRHVEEVLRG